MTQKPIITQHDDFSCAQSISVQKAYLFVKQEIHVRYQL